MPRPIFLYEGKSIIIKTTPSNKIKVEADFDEFRTWIFYLNPTDDWNLDTDWTAPIDDYGTTQVNRLYGHLLKKLRDFFASRYQIKLIDDIVYRAVGIR